MFRKTTMRVALWLLLAAMVAAPAFAAKYDPGATDKEVKVGHIGPYSGPASAYGAIGRAIGGYIKMVNEHGGVNGRKINFVTYDDGYSPPKTMEQARRLVEQDEALFLFNTLGTPPNSAIQKYMNQKKVPQLFVATGATKWGDYKDFPWTMGWQPTYQTEAKIYAKYILEHKPNAKIGILFQNDDYGKDYLKGFKDGLGAAGSKLIVMEQSFEVADPTVDSQIVNLKNSGADTFFNIATPKFAAQAIKKAGEIGWKPLHFLNNVSASIGAVLVPAGLENSKDLISTAYLMDANDPEWQKTPDYKAWKIWMDKYNPEGSLNDVNNVFGYVVAQGLVQVLKQCGDELTRDNVMKQAASIKNFHPAMLLPGINVDTSSTDYYPIEQEQLVKFDGKSWVRFGKILSAN